MIHGRIFKMTAAFATVLGMGQFVFASSAESVPGEFLVKVSNAKIFSGASALSVFSAEKVRPVLAKQNLFLVKRNILEKSEYSIDALKSLPGVLIVEPNYIYRVNRIPNDLKLGELWGLRNIGQKIGKDFGRPGIDIGAEQAWDIETGSDKVLVAVIDTGIDYNHPDLQGNVWTNEAELNGRPGVDDDNNGFVDDIHGYDFANDDGDPMDDMGHGTHVSGTIGAKGDDGKGVVGVNWNVKIMGVKFLTAEGSGTLEGAVKAINYASKNGAKIESNSWGGGGFTQILKDAIVDARDKGILFVAAAGNDANDNDQKPSYPATYAVDNVISVAAVDNRGRLAEFSSYGKKTVHVAAPGVDVTSSLPQVSDPSGYGTWSGTSMATPHVSGVAALLLAHEPNLTYKDLKSRIMNSASPVGSLRNKVVSAGVVNAYYALTNQTAPADMEDPYNWESKAYTLSTEHPYLDKATKEFTITVPGATSISIYFEKFETEKGYDTLTFKDAAGNIVDTWSGKHDGEFSAPATGNTVTLSFSSDDSVNNYGFDITKTAIKK